MLACEPISKSYKAFHEMATEIPWKQILVANYCLQNFALFNYFLKIEYYNKSAKSHFQDTNNLFQIILGSKTNSSKNYLNVS